MRKMTTMRTNDKNKGNKENAGSGNSQIRKTTSDYREREDNKVGESGSHVLPRPCPWRPPAFGPYAMMMRMHDGHRRGETTTTPDSSPRYYHYHH